MPPKKEITAPSIDLSVKGIGNPDADQGRIERLTYLCETNARITQKEIDFWMAPYERPDDGPRDFRTGGWIRRNPFILMRCGAYFVKTKEDDIRRFAPWSEQLDVINHRQECWLNQIVAEVWALKCRQDGISTETELSNLSMGIALGSSYMHIVGNEVDNAEKMLQITRLAVTGLPYWMRPDEKKMRDSRVKGVFEISDPEVGIQSLSIKTDTARKDEVIGRGEPAQIRHYTECEFWYKQETAFATLRGAQVWSFPATQTCETTGNKTMDSVFHKRFFALWGKDDPTKPGKKAFFFPWFRHAKYRTALIGISPEDFWAKLENEDVDSYEKLKAYGCDVEQANWYSDVVSEFRDGGIPLDFMRREFPFTPEEAFLGGSSTVFDGDKIRDFQLNAKRFYFGKADGLGVTAYPVKPVADDWKSPKVRGRVRYDVDLTESEFVVDATKWNSIQYERPRKGHNYLVTCDASENKLTDPGISATSDWTRIKVFRTTADPRCDEMTLATVFALRSKQIDVLEAARVCVALSRIYRNSDGSQSTISFEHNLQGTAFEVEAHRNGGKLSEQFKEIGIRQHFVGFGVHVTGGQSEASKNRSVALLREAIATGNYKPLDEDEIHELSIFECDERGRYHAPRGSHDDTVSCARLLCVYVASIGAGKVEVKRVIADGDINLVEQPEPDEIEEAWLEQSFKREMPKPDKPKQIGRWNAI